MVLQEFPELGDLGLATDESREAHRETLALAYPSRWRGLGLETGDDELPQAFRNIEILQAVMAEILQGEATGRSRSTSEPVASLSST